MLNSFDQNHDGKFDREEVSAMVTLMIREEKKIQSLKTLVIFIIAIENFLAAFAIGYVHAVHAVHVHATLRIDCTCVFRSL